VVFDVRAPATTDAERAMAARPKEILARRGVRDPANTVDLRRSHRSAPRTTDEAG
jgi:hypothetical protein